VKIDKRLTTYSLLALTIGAASVIPLAFLMSAKAITTPKTWFDSEVVYAYWQIPAQNDTLPGVSSEIFKNYAMILNLTLNPEFKNDIFSARIEYYQLQICSDERPIANISYFVGTNRTSTFRFVTPELFQFKCDELFNSNTTCGSMFDCLWKEGDSRLVAIGDNGALLKWEAPPLGFKGSSDEIISALMDAETPHRNSETWLRGS